MKLLRIRDLSVLLLAGLALLGCAGPAKDGPFELELAGETWSAERISLEVPLRHDEPEGEKIVVRLVRVFGKQRKLAPFFFLAGGPGGSGTQVVLRKKAQLLPLEKLILEQADILFIDQRGTGASFPRLHCDADAKIPLIPAPDRADTLAVGKRAFERCAKELRERGIDLGAFNTDESARDLEAVRRALDLPRISLYGGSYGSHLAFAYLRRFGSVVDHGILSLILGPGHMLKRPSQLDDLLEAIDERKPLEDGRSVVALARQVRDRLASSPVRVRVDGGAEIELGVFDFQLFVAKSTLRPVVHLRLPRAIARMAEGDFSQLARRSYDFRSFNYDGFDAMHFAMKCASGTPESRREDIHAEAAETLVGYTFNFPFPDVCPALDIPVLPDGFRARYSAEVPLLLFSGVFDSRTPVSNGQEMLGWFPKAHHVIVSNLGHSVCHVAACLELVEELLTNGGLDRPRVIEVSPTQEEIYRSYGVKRGPS